MNNREVLNVQYKGRNLVVVRMNTVFINYFCSYIEIESHELPALGNPRNEFDLECISYFDDFIGEPTFLGELRG